jgi:glycosyltransferase involved in cell wall biosynthesis
VPVIAARASSLVEVAAGDATLVDPHDAAGWIDALRALVADRDTAQRRADAARSRAVARFGWARAAAAFADLYARCGQ